VFFALGGQGVIVTWTDNHLTSEAVITTDEKSNQERKQSSSCLCLGHCLIFALMPPEKLTKYKLFFGCQKIL